MKNKYFPVLDRGFVALKDYMGSDDDIEQAARISYGKGTRKKSDTKNLIRYLMRHTHTSPFEMCELKFHVRVPMDCWRQWIRHRTASVNEYSSRYSEVPFLCQKTPANLWRLQSGDNKQGSSGYLEDGAIHTFEEEKLHQRSYYIYQQRLRSGIAREQARKDLPLSIYTEAFWKIDLHNLLHFLNLRCKINAQEEIRKYADVIAGIVKEIYPITFEAWQDYVFDSIKFSRLETKLLNLYIYANDCLDLNNKAEEFGISKRELEEFKCKLDLIRNIEESNFTLDITTAKEYADFYTKEAP